jgi:hypothetical protein
VLGRVLRLSVGAAISVGGVDAASLKASSTASRRHSTSSSLASAWRAVNHSYQSPASLRAWARVRARPVPSRFARMACSCSRPPSAGWLVEVLGREHRNESSHFPSQPVLPECLRPLEDVAHCHRRPGRAPRSRDASSLSARATPRSVVTVVPSEPRHIEPYRTEGGLLDIASDFSTVMGNHLFAVAPFAVWVRISSQVLPVHLSTRIEPKAPAPGLLVMTTAKHSCF